ncbi:MAG: DUF11 domain-containing protein, partial [Verrucomicrobiales bacterium]|nr:DUF11 domain-containing protein [Verrucomicrobiales bacterium]
MWRRPAQSTRLVDRLRTLLPSSLVTPGWRHRLVMLGFGLACLSAVVPDTSATVLDFEPPNSFTVPTPPSGLPPEYGEQVAAFSRDGFAYGASSGTTPAIRIRSETLRLLRDQPGNFATHGLRVVSGGWNHGASESACLALQPDGADDQQIRLRLHGTDSEWPVIHGFDVVGRSGQSPKVPTISISDTQLSVLYATNNVALPSNGALHLRFDPPLRAKDLLIVIAYGRTALPVGIDNLEFGQVPVQPTVWIADAIPPQSPKSASAPTLHPVRLQIPTDGHPVVSWTESFSSGAPASGWWAPRGADGWEPREIKDRTLGPSFSLFDPRGGAAFGLSSNGVPFLFYAAANFASAQPHFLARVDLSSQPNGPGAFAAALPGSSSVSQIFAIDGRASHPPDFAFHIDRDRLRHSSLGDLTTQVFNHGFNSELVFRQGPQRQAHVLYVSDSDLRLHYNGGNPNRDLAILPVNVGASSHDLAVDAANGIHVSAARGSGQFFFGAVGQLAYLHSPDGISWTTNFFDNIPADVGSTAVALDSTGQPAIAFTRAFNTLYFMRRTAGGWTAPSVVRTGLGGWSANIRSVRLALDPSDVPYVATADALSGGLLVFHTVPTPTPADLAINVQAATNRVAVGSATSITVTATNRGPRDATLAQLKVRFPAEVVVQTVAPRTPWVDGSEYTFDLGTLQSYESRDLKFTVTALDPVQVCVTAEISSSVVESMPADNQVMVCPVTFLSPQCLTSSPPADCTALRLFPEILPPAWALQPWSVDFRVPLASSNARIRAASALPPGFCLTANGQLRGLAPAAGTYTLLLEVVESDGSTRDFSRKLEVHSGDFQKNLIAFWPLDGEVREVISATSDIPNSRAVFIPGPVGLAAQTSRHPWTDPAQAWSNPNPLITSPLLRAGEPFGTGPVSLVGWFRRDG